MKAVKEKLSAALHIQKQVRMPQLKGRAEPAQVCQECQQRAQTVLRHFPVFKELYFCCLPTITP